MKLCAQAQRDLMVTGLTLGESVGLCPGLPVVYQPLPGPVTNSVAVIAEGKFNSHYRATFFMAFHHLCNNYVTCALSMWLCDNISVSLWHAQEHSQTTHHNMHKYLQMCKVHCWECSSFSVFSYSPEMKTDAGRKGEVKKRDKTCSKGARSSPNSM